MNKGCQKGLSAIFFLTRGHIRKVLASLPAEIGLVFKRHPKLFSKSPLKGLPPQANLLFLERLSITEIFRRVAGVVTLTSNVGLEAAVCGRPV